MSISSTLTLRDVSYRLPDGGLLFQGLNEQFDDRPTGLVGRNGVGKSVLARVLAGELQPTTGTCIRQGTVHYLAQQVGLQEQHTVADLAGLRPVLDALARVEAGGTDMEDFERLADRWDIRQRFEAELSSNGLGHLDADTLVTQLSGGESMRVRLIGAFLSAADFLILDEPSNHLDLAHRRALRMQLRRWRGALLLVSHDRMLLEDMQRIVELSPLGLRSYGGGYAFYQECWQREQENAEQALAQRRLERRREERVMLQQRERQERRQAGARRQAHTANQAKILLGRQKERSEASIGRLQAQHEARREQLAVQVRAAADGVRSEGAIVLRVPGGDLPAASVVCRLEGVELPFGPLPWRKLDLTLTGPRRIALVGPNGCGKSTLMRVLAGQLTPRAGRCEVKVPSIYLDQQLRGLSGERPVFDQLREVNRRDGDGELRMRLAQLGLTASKVTMPAGRLSGGEQLKAALACALYADVPATLLLLDEPDNHLDLSSREALEQVLLQYRGALVVVSHDPAFLAALHLDGCLEATAQGWRLHDCAPAEVLDEGRGAS